MKFHVSKDGLARVCKAQEGRCPLGGGDVHFSSKDEAEAYGQELNEKEFSLLPTANNKYDVNSERDKVDEISVNRFDRGHRLVKQDDKWIQLDEYGDAIGVMEKPLAIYHESGDIAVVYDTSSFKGKLLKGVLRTASIMSKMRLINGEKGHLLRETVMIEPESHVEPFLKSEALKHRDRAAKEFNVAERKRSRGKLNNNRDLYGKDNEDTAIGQYMRSKEEEIMTKEPNEPIEFDPETDSWEDVPKAVNMPISYWKEKNLDLAYVGGSWAVLDDQGRVYGRMDNVNVIMNFETENIEAIVDGRGAKRISGDEEVNKSRALGQGDPIPRYMIGTGTLNAKNNSLSTIRKALDKRSESYRQNADRGHRQRESLRSFRKASDSLSNLL